MCIWKLQKRDRDCKVDGPLNSNRHLGSFSLVNRDAAARAHNSVNKAIIKLTFHRETDAGAD